MGFEIRNEKTWRDFSVVSAASYGMEISIVGFYPSDDKYGLLEERSGRGRSKSVKIILITRPRQFPMLT